MAHSLCAGPQGPGHDIEPVAFTGIRKILDGRYEQVPIIEDNGQVVADSWAIAQYLDRTYPDRAPLFRTYGEYVAARFFDRWIFRDVVPHMYHCYVLDNYNLARPEDREYLRESRERRFLGGRKLEDVVKGREKRLPLIRESLQPLRVTLAENPWLGGLRPNYMDFCALSVFLWAAAINTLPPLEKRRFALRMAESRLRSVRRSRPRRAPATAGAGMPHRQAAGTAAERLRFRAGASPDRQGGCGAAG